MNKVKLIYSSIISAVLSIIFIAVITIWGELSVPLKTWLKNLTGHHWVSKSILVLVIYFVSFVVVYLFLRNARPERLKKALWVLNVVVIVSVLVVTGFFVWRC